MGYGTLGLGGDCVKTPYLGKIAKKYKKFEKMSENFVKVFFSSRDDLEPIWSPPVKTHFFRFRSKNTSRLSSFSRRRQLSQPNYRTRLTLCMGDNDSQNFNSQFPVKMGQRREN